MFLVYLFVFSFPSDAIQNNYISKVSQKKPVFVACDIDKEQSTILSGLWFKYQKGELYLANKNRDDKIEYKKIKGECTLEPNYIR